MEAGGTGPRHERVHEVVDEFALFVVERVGIEERQTAAQLVFCHEDWSFVFGYAAYWSSPTALAGTSNAANVIETAVNHPMRTVTSTIPASPSRALARWYSPSGT